MERTLIITGKGRISAIPDIIIIRFPIEGRDMSYGEAVKKLNSLVNSLRKIILGLGVEKDVLKTTDFRVDTLTVRDQKTKEDIFAGYSAQHDLELEIPFDNTFTNALISGISDLDSLIKLRISFGVKDKAFYQKQLIENAIENAKTHAITISKSTGVILKEILTINYSFSELYLRSDTSVMYETRMSYMEDSMPDLNPGDINVDETVTISWRIE
jgi:uncharacterized protein YggE